MGYFRFNYRSELLNRYVDVSVVYPTDGYRLPPGGYPVERCHRAPVPADAPRWRPGMKFQTVYLMHGGGDDDTLTYRYSNIEGAAQRNHVMLVTPNIANSLGLDTAYGVPYLSFVTEELPTVIQALFASSPKREDNFIMGYAMGGNVALGAAVNRPDRYLECVDISGGIGMSFCPHTLQSELEGSVFREIFPLYNHSFGPGASIPGSRYDLRAELLRHREAGDPECRFHLICGSDEFIRTRMEGDVAALQELGADMDYLCAEGYDHDFRLWNYAMQLALDRLLPLKRRPIYPDEE